MADKPEVQENIAPTHVGKAQQIIASLEEKYKLSMHTKGAGEIIQPKLASTKGAWQPAALKILNSLANPTKPNTVLEENNRPDYLGAINLKDIHTQKAKGMWAIVRGMGMRPPGVAYPDDNHKISLIPQCALPTKSYYPLFGRPCPKTPRHGFVESRVVADAGEALALLAEARREDPEAELILMPQLTGKNSFVATNAGVSWGQSNDGATGGHSLTIPTPGSVADFKENMRLREYFGIENSLFVEGVESEYISRLVQFRDGPEVPNTLDYIPYHLYDVNDILVPLNDDLLQWERVILRAKGAKKTVVNLVGMSLSSHFAVHAIAAGLPVVTSRKVVRGENLSPVSEDTTLTSMALREIAAYATRYVKLDYIYNFTTKAQRRNNGWAESLHHISSIATAIATTHSMALWPSREHLWRLRAAAPVTMLRFMAAAVVGEMRHWYAHGPADAVFETMKVVKEFEEFREAPEDDFTEMVRETIYTILLHPTSLPDLKAIFIATMQDFYKVGWTIRTNNHGALVGNSYGGRAWGEISLAGFRLTSALEAFLARPTEHNTYLHLVLELNKAVNVVHNGGTVFNKWIDSSTLNAIAVVPAVGFMGQGTHTIIKGSM